MLTKAVFPAAASTALLTIAAFTPSQSTSPSPNFAEDIAPIIQKKCLPCHGPGGIGPFDFTSYRKFNQHIELIRIQTLSRNMPPTHSSSDFGHIATAPPLTDEELVTIQSYIRAGTPEGTPLLSPITRPSEAATRPILTINPKNPKPSRAEGVMYWQTETFPISNPIHLTALSITPENPRVVRSAQFYLAQPGTDPLLIPENPNVLISFPTIVPLGSWAPGFPSWKLPPRTSFTLPKGSLFIVASKIQPSGRSQSTNFALNLTVTPQPQSNAAQIISFRKTNFEIPANEVPTLTLGKALTHPATLIGIIPKARFYCGQIESTITQPKQPPRTLLALNRWSPFWMGNYQFKAPIAIPANSQLEFKFTYYNDDRCEMNENRAPETVVSGTRWTDEACEMHLLISRPRN